MHKKSADTYKNVNIRFIGSFPSEPQCPQDRIPVYAFIGRSNVGKSSLINMISERKAIAKVSKTPGKTRLINYFLVNESWYLVDLPGYGYAKVSKTMRKDWEKMINRFLLLNKSLVSIFQLIDLRHELQKIDLEFMQWMGTHKIPFVIIYTKADKLKKAEVPKNVQKIQKALLKDWNTLPLQFVSSSEKGWGREEILEFIWQTNHNLGISESK